MEKHNLNISSGYLVDQNKKIIKYPTNIREILLFIALGMNPIAHPTVCIKRDLLLPYNNKLYRAEDFELWVRLILSGNFKYKGFSIPLTKYNNLRSLEKDSENAIAQIKIRTKILIKIFIIGTALFIGIIPNLIRIILGKNRLLFLRRNI